AGGLVVSLSIVSTSLATVSPASVAISAGQLTSPSFTVSGVVQGTTTLNATATGVSAGTESVYVNAPPALSLNGSGSWLGSGLHNSGRLYVQLNAPTDPGGTTITLTSSDPTVVGVPATVTIPNGGNYAYYDIAGNAIGSATVTATATGWATSNVITINVGQSYLSLGNYNTSRTTLSSPDTLYVYENTPNCGTCDYTVNAITVDLTVNSATSGIVSVTTPVTIAAGAYYTTATISTPTAAGSYTITASSSSTTITSATTTSTNVSAPGLSL